MDDNLHTALAEVDLHFAHDAMAALYGRGVVEHVPQHDSITLIELAHGAALQSQYSKASLNSYTDKLYCLIMIAQKSSEVAVEDFAMALADYAGMNEDLQRSEE
jgi:hypothetical protein